MNITHTTLRFSAILSLFLVLLATTRLLTGQLAARKEHDSLLLNRAGMQRTLLERYAAEINRAMIGLAVDDWKAVLHHKQEAEKAVADFRAAHETFMNGGILEIPGRGVFVKIPSTKSEQMQAAFEAVGDAHETFHRFGVMALRSDRWDLKDNDFVTKLLAQRDATVQAMDNAVWLIQMESEERLARLKMVQGTALAVAILLFSGTILYVHRRIVTPVANAFRDTERLQQQLDLILQSAGDAIFGVGIDGRVDFANAEAARLLKTDTQGLVGRHLHDVVHGSDAHPRNKCPIENTLTYGDDSRSHEDWFITTDGKRVPIEYKCTPLQEGSTMSGMVVTCRDMTARKKAEKAMAEANSQMIELSRTAGMAEVATGVLHNVGNVLNSVNVSVTTTMEQLRKKKSPKLLRKLTDLLSDNRDCLADFLTNDARGKMIPQFVTQVCESAEAEQTALVKEVAGLQEHVNHIKEVVQMQQSVAATKGCVEKVPAVAIMEDALKLNDPNLVRHGIEVVRDFESDDCIQIDRHKVLQVLVNLIGNAKHAVQDLPLGEARIELIVAFSDDAKRVRYIVRDNGIGIAPENLKRIFFHGFTTKKDGHGFGLHSCANAARELNGFMHVDSKGTGHGAEFLLDVPVSPEASENAGVPEAELECVTA